MFQQPEPKSSSESSDFCNVSTCTVDTVKTRLVSNYLTLKMTFVQVVETSVNVISNSPFQDYMYTHPDYCTLLNYKVITTLYIL